MSDIYIPEQGALEDANEDVYEDLEGGAEDLGLNVVEISNDKSPTDYIDIVTI